MDGVLMLCLAALGIEALAIVTAAVVGVWWDSVL